MLLALGAVAQPEQQFHPAALAAVQQVQASMQALQVRIALEQHKIGVLHELPVMVFQQFAHSPTLALVIPAHCRCGAGKLQRLKARAGQAQHIAAVVAIVLDAIPDQYFDAISLAGHAWTPSRVLSAVRLYSLKSHA